MPPLPAPPLTLGQCATLACLLEAMAAKPGNVHPGADFADMTFADLATSAVLVGPCVDAAAGRRVGQTVWEAVRVTRAAVTVNTNLGTLLLFGPLAKVPRAETVRDGLPQVLAELDAIDAQLVYDAIRMADPGGLGRREMADVRRPPDRTLVEAMALAAADDLVARQYTNGFQEVLEQTVPWLVEDLARGRPLDQAIVHVQLQLLRDHLDSLMCRKCGVAVARQASARAADALAGGPPGSAAYRQAVTELDRWLRADGHRRNPGTIADLIAAGLFVALRERMLELPVRWDGEGSRVEG